MSLHGDALKALFPEGTTVFVNDPPTETQVKDLPTDAFPYVVIWLPEGVDDPQRLGFMPHWLDFDFQTVAVSLSMEGMEGMSADVKAALYRARPVVEGRRCHRIRRISTLAPSAPSEDIPGRRIFQAHASWHLVSKADTYAA